MDNKGVATQRKNHVLSDSSKRLKNLVKSDHGDEQELKPASKMEKSPRRSPGTSSPRGKSSKTSSRSRGAADKDQVVEEGDPTTVRFFGYLQLHLYFFALVVGAFLCYHRHHTDTPNLYPRFLLNMFTVLKNRRAHHFADKLFKLWNEFPEPTKKKFVKYLGYGTVFVYLFPVLTAPMKPKKPEGDQTEVEPPKESESKVNQAVVKYGASFFRTLSATVLCGLLGYDVAYNLKYFKSLLFKK